MQYVSFMKQRTRKLFGTFYIVIIALLYAVISTTIAASIGCWSPTKRQTNLNFVDL